MSEEKLFKPGDLVRLKSGTDEMTVSKVEGDEVHVTWMRDGQVHREIFNQAMLAPPIDPMARLPIVV